MAVVPLVQGEADDAPEQPAGRIRDTRRLLTAAALIMSVLLVGPAGGSGEWAGPWRTWPHYASRPVVRRDEGLAESDRLTRAPKRWRKNLTSGRITTHLPRVG